MNIKGQKERRSELIGNLDNILKIADKEGRDLTEEENKEYKSLESELEIVEDNVAKLEKQEARKKELAKDAAELDARAIAGAPASKSEDKEKQAHKEAYSMKRSFNALMNGEALTGREKEVHDEAVNEARQFNTSINGLGIPSWMLETRTDVDQATSDIKPTAVGSYVAALRDSSIYEKAGATVINGLTADYKIPVVTGQSLAWASAENSAAADGGSNFANPTLTPTRLTGYVDVSNRIGLQNGEGAMSALMADLGRETANKINAAIFASADVTNAVDSLGGTSGVLTFTEATYSANASILSDFIEAEVTLANDHGLDGNLAYVASSKLLTDLKKSAQVASIIPAMENQRRGEANVNGYPTYFNTYNTSSGSASADFFFGDFSKLFVGFFGGLDMVVDPYSVLLNDQRRIVVHRHLDAKAVQGAAFVKATSLLA